MKPIAVATLESKASAKPISVHRLRTIPKRISGLYRLSIVSKNAFEVDIGGKIFDKVRTLDVFHETPMFVDEVKNMAAVDLLNQGSVTRKVRLYPTSKALPLQFRITAHEEMLERYEFERTKSLGSLETPLEHKGLVKHIFETVRDDDDEIEAHSVSDNMVDVAMGLLAISLSAGAALALSSLILAATAAPTYAPALIVCDPSRTYINGALFKNLKEVKVKIFEGTIVGYTYS
jgi:hypothetical protein